MAVTKEQVDVARAAFMTSPQPATAAMFFSKLREAEENGSLEPDEWLNGLADLEAYLWRAAK